MTDAPRDPRRHGPVEDALGIATGALVISLGIALLRSAEVATGGTAGLSLLLTYATGWAFPLVFVLVNAPFFVLAALRKGRRFTVRSAVAIMAVAALAPLHRVFLPDGLDVWWAAIVGCVLCGVGLVILFRHDASLGGFNVVALLLQERLGWRAGWTQMVLDGAVVVASLALLSPIAFAASLVGAVVVNLVLALNHRPDRYLGW